jgi:hypothetical protein
VSATPEPEAFTNSIVQWTFGDYPYLIFILMKEAVVHNELGSISIEVLVFRSAGGFTVLPKRKAF